MIDSEDSLKKDKQKMEEMDMQFEETDGN
jgi:hypothetical protein